MIASVFVVDDEIHQLLRELTETTGAETASVVHGRMRLADDLPAEPTRSPAPPAHSVHVSPLGNDTFLHLTGIEAGSPDGATIERGVRALRACARRWGLDRIPEMLVRRGTVAKEPPAQRRVHARITAYLQALANVQSARFVMVVLRGRVVCESAELDELSRERIPFIRRRLEVTARRQRTSHAEIWGDDFYALSFWFDACLVAFFSGPYALDFFRHRARMVTRELSYLLAMWDEPPPAPASVAPIPE